MTEVLLTPLDLSDATKVGRRTYRKQLLPKTSIKYQGRNLDFNDAYLVDLAKSFTDGAYDQVPIVFADDQNGHNMDPKRFGGEVKGFEVTSDGLDAIVELTDDGATAVDKNPKLGVSARIVEGLTKADGRTFGRAVQHVLLTMDPRVTNLRPWQAVDLSGKEADEQVVDLTAETYEEGTVGKPTVDKSKQTITTESGKILDLSNLSDEDFAALLELSETDPEGDAPVGDVPPPGDKPDEHPEGEVFEEDGKKYVVLNGEKLLLTPAVAPVEPDQVLADLSNTTKEIRDWRTEVAKDRWETERTKLASSGVPPFLLDLAAPVLSSPDTLVIDLADNGKVDATDTIRKMLQGTKGFIDLHPEVGHQVDLSVDADSDDAKLAAAWEAGNY